MEAEILKTNGLAMQLCVPENYTEGQILEFAEKKDPCGAFNGWQLAKTGSIYLAGDKERVNCAVRNGYVHVVVGC